MPALRLCGRRTLISGDELRMYSLLIGCGRLIQLGLAIVLTMITLRLREFDIQLRPFLECEQIDPDLELLSENRVYFLMSYVAISLALPVASLLAVIPMYIIAGRGTPTDTAPRHLMPTLCYISMFLDTCLLLPALTLGIFYRFFSYEFSDCMVEEQELQIVSSDLYHARDLQKINHSIFIISVVLHAIDTGLYICKLAYLVCCRVIHVGLDSDSCWSTFCNVCMVCSASLTCCLFGGTKAIRGDFSDISILLANFFNHDEILDITPSDVAAGLVMVRRADKVEVMKKRSVLSFASMTGSNKFLPTTRSRFSLGIREVLIKEDNQDLHAIAEGAWFSKYAAASYGWVAVMLIKPITGTVHIIWNVFRYCTCFSSSASKKYINDIPLQLRRLSIQAVLDHLYEQDVLYASFEHNVKATPYFVAMDHNWKVVVLSIRGTMSLESILADITLSPVSLEEAGEKCGFDGRGHHCHRGMLDCATWIYEDLKRHGLLDEVIGPSGTHKEYTLRVVGHSLGAGISAVLSLMLRSEYPNLRCLAFGAPGCVFDEELAEECSAWTTSFVVDCDIISRISKESVEALRNDVLEMIARIKVSKHKVFDLEGLKKAKHSEQTLSKLNDDILFNVDEVESSDFRKQLEAFYTFQETLKEKDASTYICLHIPGKLLHLHGIGKEATNGSLRLREQFRNFGATSCDDNGNDGNYTTRWAKRRDFDKIVLSSHLLWDHHPGWGIKSFQDVASRFGLHEPYFVEREYIDREYS